MQATAYVVSVWEAVAARAGTTTDRLPITLRDLRIHQAVRGNVHEPVALSVHLTQHAHHFQVVHPPNSSYLPGAPPLPLNGAYPGACDTCHVSTQDELLNAKAI